MRPINLQDFKSGDLVELHLVLGASSKLVSTGVVLELCKQDHYPFADGLKIGWTNRTITIEEPCTNGTFIKLIAKHRDLTNS